MEIMKEQVEMRVEESEKYIKSQVDELNKTIAEGLETA
jgi:hypothetical protein